MILPMTISKVKACLLEFCKTLHLPNVETILKLVIQMDFQMRPITSTFFKTNSKTLPKTQNIFHKAFLKK